MEGETDEIFLSKALDVLQSQGQFAGRHYQYLPCGGAEGVALLMNHFQPKPDQMMFCLFDSDSAGWKTINKIFGVAENTYNSRNFGKAKKIGNIWVAPYPKGKSRVAEFNIEDYFGHGRMLHYVLSFRSLNEVWSKDAIKRAMSRDCENGDIADKYFSKFAYVFDLIDTIRAADVAGSDHL